MEWSNLLGTYFSNLKKYNNKNYENKWREIKETIIKVSDVFEEKSRKPKNLRIVQWSM